jgi:hypothetical protein
VSSDVPADIVQASEDAADHMLCCIHWKHAITAEAALKSKIILDVMATCLSVCWQLQHHAFVFSILRGVTDVPVAAVCNGKDPVFLCHCLRSTNAW